MQAVDRQGALFQLIKNSHDASDLLLFCSPFFLKQSWQWGRMDQPKKSSLEEYLETKHA